VHVLTDMPVASFRYSRLNFDGNICADLGHKAVASENSLLNRILFLNAPELVPVSQNEEHLVLEAGAGLTYLPVDILYGLPYHICPTVALYENVQVAKNNFITSSGKIRPGPGRSTFKNKTHGNYSTSGNGCAQRALFACDTARGYHLHLRAIAAYSGWIAHFRKYCSANAALPGKFSIDPGECRQFIGAGAAIKDDAVRRGTDKHFGPF